MVADGVANDDERVPFERPDEVATAEVDNAKDKSITEDFPAVRRGTIGQLTTDLEAAED